MDPNNSQVGSRAKEATALPLQPSRATPDLPSTRGWTAANLPAGQGTGPNRGASAHATHSHARNLSVGSSIESGSGVPDAGQQQESGLQPALHRQGRGQLPSFISLISAVDDPNEKNPILPIPYNNNGPDGNVHTSSSPAVRKQHICHACKKTFPSKNSLSKHKQIHGERSHICPICNSKFHTKKDLTRHRDTVHAQNSPNYVCPVLDCARSNPRRAFSRRDNLRQHILQLHDKKYLEEIRPPQSSLASQGDKNASRSPEGGSSPHSDGLANHSIDEGIDEQHERIEVRTPIPISGEEDVVETEEAMTPGVEGKGKGKAAEYDLIEQYPLGFPANAPHSPQEPPEDVVMSTSPKFLVQDFGHVPEQEPLTEIRNRSISHDLYDYAETDEQAPKEEDLDETWVINFLEGIEATELDQIARLSPGGLKRKYPYITTQRRLGLIKFALRGFLAGWYRGYQCAHAKTLDLPALAPPASSRSSLSVISPSHISDGKTSLSPLTPTSISATSPTNRHGNESGPTGSFGAGTSPQKEPPSFRGDNSFVVPHHPRTNASVQEISKPIAVPSKAEDIPRPSSQNVATDTENAAEPYKCEIDKCGKIFSKKSEFKKHMQRHRRPFFCTFHWQERGEVQRFGSKDDWRRHEEHRHYQSEFYKCPGGPHESCLGDFPGRSDFERHLETHHESEVAKWTFPNGKIDEDIKREYFQRHHNGTDYIEDNFWCGFCAKLINIPQEMTGRRGKEIRVNHVADHFHKEQKDIRLWVKYNECNLADTSTALNDAHKNYSREVTLRENDLEVQDQQRQLPRIRDIFGPPANLEFWICCECQYLAQSKPNFVYAMNIGKDIECSSAEHQIHRRCHRCSLARS